MRMAFGVLILFLTIFSGCKEKALETFMKNAHTISEKDICMLSIDNVEISDKNIIIGYTINNYSSKDIWICDKMDIYGSNRVAVALLDDMAFVSIKSNLPNCNTYLGEALVTRYLRLSPNDSKQYNIHLDLPLMNKSPVCSHEITTSKTISYIVAEVGYFSRDLKELIWEYIKTAQSNPDDEIKYFGAETLKGFNKDESVDYAYVYHLWDDGLKEEEVVSRKIQVSLNGK